MRRLLRLLYLLAQHPVHGHRWLVDRGLAQGWIKAFAPFWDSVRPSGLPITDYTSFMWLCYHFSAKFRERHPTGDHFDDPDAQYARLLSYVLRRERHPLRMLRVAWVLRRCRTVLEFGAGAAPYAYFIQRAWLTRQRVYAYDLPGTLIRQYNQQYSTLAVGTTDPFACDWDGIVCTEVFEHVDDPVWVAGEMIEASPVICFDYVDDGTFRRRATLDAFARRGALTGPDRRGLYVWCR